MGERIWYYMEGGSQQGPVTREELLEGLARRLPPGTLVWRDGMTGWLPAEQVPELGVAARPPAWGAAPPPPPSSGSSTKVLIIVGIVVGGLLVVPACIGIVAAIAIPSLLRARVSANEAATIGDTRTVISAEAAYQSANSGYYGTLTCLATPSGCIPGYQGPTFLDSTLAREAPYTKQGYLRQWHETPAAGSASPGSLDKFCYGARPAVANKTGVRSFGGDSSGIIGQSTSSTQCCTAEGVDLSACPPLP